MSLNTPWGPAQQQTTIVPGVIWVSTASHGGLMVKQAVAGVELSPKAVEVAYPGQFGYWVCFEEDVNYAVAFHEHPEWDRILRSKDLASTQKYAASQPSEYDATGKRMKEYALEHLPKAEAFLAQSDAGIAAEHAKTVKEWNPEYFGLATRCGGCREVLPLEAGTGFVLCVRCKARMAQDAGVTTLTSQRYL